MRLVNVTRGRLASRGIVSNVTILANDDPFGLFEFDPSLLTIEEANRNITVTIVRRQGTMGTTRVYYTSVPSNVGVSDVMYDRAEEDKDFHPVSGFVDFRPNQTVGNFVVTILDDVIPEDNETIVVNLTSVMLMGGQDFQSGTVTNRSLLSCIVMSCVVKSIELLEVEIEVKAFNLP